MSATVKQIEYANFLMDRLDSDGLLEDAIHDINPDFKEDEDIGDWFRRISVHRMSEVIDSLKSYCNG